MGARGPKKGTKYPKGIAKERMRERLRQRVEKELDPLIDAMMDKAKGIWVRETTVTGQQRVYKEPPDPQAFKLLTEHAIGKPTQPLEGSGEEGEIVFKWQQ